MWAVCGSAHVLFYQMTAQNKFDLDEWNLLCIKVWQIHGNVENILEISNIPDFQSIITYKTELKISKTPSKNELCGLCYL